MDICTHDAPEPVYFPAMVSINPQPWEIPYSPNQGLRQGTIFPCLDKPFFTQGGEFNV